MVVFGVGLTLRRPDASEAVIESPPEPPRMVRPLPEALPPGTHLPDIPESRASGSIDLSTFSPGRDLTYVDDDRAWWESDNDKRDTECDHTVHRSMRGPLERLIDLVAERGGALKIQDAYRPSLIHNARSLHKEGRAIDLTCEDMDLEELGRLCWAAGFDWVYHERGNRSNGPHMHCSVKR